jgi:hypothetical protein
VYDCLGSHQILGEALATYLDRYVRARKASEASVSVSRIVSLGVTLLHSERETTEVTTS